ncbi:spore germination protein [Paenibacillus taihuensis]|uniref:Spore germination protein n=1 Tax=Paenibacillus taihuensis TaxID=1156355 RepID=A0A3D9S8H2_9BACL|nr:GerAB/ArcD/ProY family transporter [Paenibacillus taihuensis]REE89015.1 spore germination protein [Paenibacillus taihuensis]
MTNSFNVTLAYIITHIGLIFFIYPTDVIESTSQSHWMPVVTAFIFHLVIVFTYLKGLSYFEGRNLVMIMTNRHPLLAWLTLLPVLLYLLDVIILMVRANAEIISIVCLANTPLWMLMLLMLLIPGYMVIRGNVKSLLRLALLISFLFALPCLFVISASFQNIDWRYVLPLIPRREAFNYLAHPSFYKSLFAFTGVFLLLGYFPSFAKVKMKSIFLGGLVLLPMYLISVYVPILTLGEETALQLQYPYIFAVDTLEIDWLMFDRVTVFLLMSLIAFGLLFIGFTIWQIMYTIKYSFKKWNSTLIVLIVLLIVYTVCLCIPDWQLVDQFLQWNTFLRIYISIVTPSIIFVLGLIHHSKVNRELNSI